MKLIRPTYLEGYLVSLLLHDVEINKMLANWELEINEISSLLIDHYTEMGLLTVEPTRQAKIFRKDLIHQLTYSKDIKKRREQIRREIEKAREKNRARADDLS